ncbi:MAG TPA: FmdB family zinc ribbon protein [Aggregatilineales bacterium]|nr:FmdB family zinc ribbon protein [Aggregatilineales bacterium]
MPIYTYECENCGQRFDAKQSFSEAPLTICPDCEGALHRVIQPVGIVFKGSGFYVTDSRGKQNLATTSTRKDEAKPAAEGTGSSDSAASSTGDSNTSAKTEKAEASPKAETTKSTATADA